MALHDRVDLLLMRHGQAEDYASGGDAERALTEHGRAQAAAVGRSLGRLGLRPTVLCCSPLRRAQQTLGAVAEAAGVADAPIQIVARLVSGAAPGQVIAAIADATRDAGPAGGSDPVVLAVGHNPSVSTTIASLLGCAGSMSIAASPADLAHLRVDLARNPIRGQLVGYFSAGALRQLID